MSQYGVAREGASVVACCGGAVYSYSNCYILPFTRVYFGEGSILILESDISFYCISNNSQLNICQHELYHVGIWQSLFIVTKQKMLKKCQIKPNYSCAQYLSICYFSTYFMYNAQYMNNVLFFFPVPSFDRIHSGHT